jgi:arylsulfatase A
MINQNYNYRIMRHLSLFLLQFAICQYTIAQEHPNIILILVDDLGYGDVSCYNPDGKISTPNIDKLAKEGMLFTDAHTSAAQCSPTRYGLLTGRYSWRTRLKAAVLPHFDRPLIEKDRMTIASFLKTKGYATACIGKWHLGMGWQAKDGLTFDPTSWDPAQNLLIDYSKPLTSSPNDNGFDYYFGINGSNNMLPYCLIENNRVVTVPDQPKYPIFDTEIEEGLLAYDYDSQNLEQIMFGKAMAWLNRHLEEQPDKPFFLYYPMTAIHRPCLPDDSFIGVSEAGLKGGKVEEVDYLVGKLVQWIRDQGIEKNTMLIFTSDNGGNPGDPIYALNELATHDYGQKYMPNYWIEKDSLIDINTPYNKPVGSDKYHIYNHFSSGSFKGYKASIYEGGHRVPFIVKWPAKVMPGEVRNELVSTLDFLPTFAELFETKLPENAGEDSYSFLPLLLGKDEFTARSILVNNAWNKNTLAIRVGDWKLIPFKGSGNNENYPEVEEVGQLYNLADDPSESVNLYDKYPEIVKKLSITLDSIVYQNK